MWLLLYVKRTYCINDGWNVKKYNNLSTDQWSLCYHYFPNYMFLFSLNIYFLTATNTKKSVCFTSLMFGSHPLTVNIGMKELQREYERFPCFLTSVWWQRKCPMPHCCSVPIPFRCTWQLNVNSPITKPKFNLPPMSQICQSSIHYLTILLPNYFSLTLKRILANIKEKYFPSKCTSADA